MPTDRDRVSTVYFTERRCPKCGATLLSNGSLAWCSFVGDQRPGGVRACDFGIAERVRMDQLPKEATP